MTIQEVLDRCLEDIHSGSASAEECLARYPQYAAELRPLLRTAARLENVNEIRPNRAFKSRLRKQLTGEDKKPRRRFFTLHTFVVWAVIVLLVTIFAVWMSISFEVAGHATTPMPTYFQPPSTHAQASFDLGLPHLPRGRGVGQVSFRRTTSSSNDSQSIEPGQRCGGCPTVGANVGTG
jgi:hypothetical protein